jgi:uncharacterized FlgJ-related protein
MLLESLAKTIYFLIFVNYNGKILPKDGIFETSSRFGSIFDAFRRYLVGVNRHIFYDSWRYSTFGLIGV